VEKKAASIPSEREKIRRKIWVAKLELDGRREQGIAMPVATKKSVISCIQQETPFCENKKV